MTEQTQEIPLATPPVQQTPVEANGKSKFISIAILLIVILLIGIGGIYAVKRFNQSKACTQEAQVCPDGSSVGRTGPNCEFAPCPTRVSSPTQTLDETANWKTYNGENFSLKYPLTWKASVENDETITISSGLPGRSELRIGKIADKNMTELKKSVLSDFNEPPETRELILGTAQATEYYGCSGVEGCMWGYTIIASNGNQLYFVRFRIYPDQPKNLYHQILSTFKFLD